MKLEAVDRSAARGNDASRAGQLRAYVNEVNAQSGKALTSEQAEILIRLAGGLL